MLQPCSADARRSRASRQSPKRASYTLTTSCSLCVHIKVYSVSFTGLKRHGRRVNPIQQNGKGHPEISILLVHTLAWRTSFGKGFTLLIPSNWIGWILECVMTIALTDRHQFLAMLFMLIMLMRLVAMQLS